MSSPLPRVQIVATGGTLAGLGLHRLDYSRYAETGKKLTIQKSLARIPEANDIAEVQGEDFLSIGSTSIGPPDWLRLAGRINEIFAEDGTVAGVVVTHGTATLEETAYFLHLTVKSPRPVVITGAMRPPSSLGTDADVNLLDAVRIAACPDAVGKGVLTILNNEIQSARDVTKTNNTRVETFKSNEMGFLGYADGDGKVVFQRAPVRKHTTATPFNLAELPALPRVDMVYSYAGADGLLVDAVRDHGSDGLVLVGFGGASYPPAVLEAGARAVEDGIPVVFASRATAGRIIVTPRNQELGFIACEDLLPQKARILLMLALTVTQDRESIQQIFREY